VNANIDVPTLQVRPPWPDELPRIKQFLKGQRSPQETLYPAVLVAPAPERIVGAAALGHTTGSSAGRFYSKFRPRIHQSTFCGPLVAYTESKARELGCTELISESDDSPKDERFFSELGFANVKTEELWLLELRKIMARVEKLADRAMKKKDDMGGVASGDKLTLQR
jgi:N-acetylglutamate synthase-like GNAT family acetyltransferase